MIHPDVAHGAAVAQRDEVPVVSVVLSLGGLIPFPVLVEFQVADDDVAAALNIELAVADGRGVRRENRQSVLLLDINVTFAGYQQHGMKQGCCPRAERLAVGFRRGLDFIIAEIEVVHDLNDLDGLAVERVRKVGRGIDLGVVGIRVRQHAAAGRSWAKPTRLYSVLATGTVGVTVSWPHRWWHSHAVGGRNIVAAISRGLDVWQGQRGRSRARNRHIVVIPLVADGRCAVGGCRQRGRATRQNHL